MFDVQGMGANLSPEEAVRALFARTYICVLASLLAAYACKTEGRGANIY